MADRTLHVVVRTPRENAVEIDAASLRLPTDTGFVGLRPNCEPTVAAVEPGLIVARLPDAAWMIGTAGGVLSCDGARAEIFTPLAVVGQDADSVLGELDRALETPIEEMQARAALDRLENGILRELRQSDTIGAPTVRHR